MPSWLAGAPLLAVRCAIEVFLACGGSGCGAFFGRDEAISPIIGVFAEVVTGLLLCSCRSQAFRRCSRQQCQSRGGDDVQVAVGEREAADGDGEVLGEELESGFDPGLAVRDALAAEEGPPDAAGHAVVVGSDRDIHQLPLGHRHRGDSCRIRGHWSAPCGSRGRSSRIMPVLFRPFSVLPRLRGKAAFSPTGLPTKIPDGPRIMPVLFRSSSRESPNAVPQLPKAPASLPRKVLAPFPTLYVPKLR